MTLIVGVGDEVVQFVVVVAVVLVAALAWCSTNARPDRYRTVVLMRSRSQHPVTVSFRTRNNMMLTNTQNRSSPAATEPPGTNPTSEESPRDNARVIALHEMDSIVDADMAMLANNRLHFYRRVDSPSNPQSAAESTGEESEGAEEEPRRASSAQMREMDSIVSAMEADVASGCDLFSRPTQASSSADTEATKNDNTVTSAPSTSNVNNTENNNNAESSTEAVTDEGTSGGDHNEQEAVTEQPERKNILIKLKYLNDTLKEVEGRLDELLKDFKWRHFSSELSAESRVRLIFNGRLLLDDAATLRACGLHHRAVVHCLVHPRRAAHHQPLGAERAPAPPREAPPERAWDLENILMTLVSVALTTVWFFRCEYSNMFTASASVALFGLTVFYSVAIFGLYLSDTFHSERRAPPATVNQ